MKKIFSVLLVMFCIAGGFTGFVLADELQNDAISDELMLVIPILGTSMPQPVELTAYHPLSMIFFEADISPMQAVSSLVWLPADMTDGNPGLYYEKILMSVKVPEGVSYFSAF